MKKSILILAVAALAACSSPKSYNISGKLDIEGTTVYLLDGEQNPIDSAEMNDGAFIMEGTFEAPSMCALANTRDGSDFSARFFLEEGDIVVGTDPENPTGMVVTGTPANDALIAYNTTAKALIEEYYKEDTSEERRAAIEAEYDKLAPAALEANHDNLFGVLMLQQAVYELTGEEILAETALFPEELQKNEMLAKLRDLGERKAKVAVGCPYIEVEQPTPAGEMLSLKATVENPANKYVLLDFWASWCGPCMGEVPFLKQAYEAYHDKGFEIYAISLDRDAARWNAAIDNNGMNWLHVSTLDYFDNAAAEPYAVQSIPTNYLIDCSNGTIAAINLRGEALDTKLAELLGE